MEAPDYESCAMSSDLLQAELLMVRDPYEILMASSNCAQSTLQSTPPLHEKQPWPQEWAPEVDPTMPCYQGTACHVVIWQITQIQWFIKLHHHQWQHANVQSSEIGWVVVQNHRQPEAPHLETSMLAVRVYWPWWLLYFTVLLEYGFSSWFYQKLLGKGRSSYFSYQVIITLSVFWVCRNLLHSLHNSLHGNG